MALAVIAITVVRTPRATVLLDCGLFQGPRRESQKRNRELPIVPHELDAVVLRALSRDRAARYATVAALDDDLANVQSALLDQLLDEGIFELPGAPAAHAETPTRTARRDPT